MTRPVVAAIMTLGLAVGGLAGVGAGRSRADPPPPYGYWLVTSDGGVFSFGSVPFYGSLGGRPLNRPIVGMAATPASGGYWLVASDGGIFAFGDAGFRGSTGSLPLNKPIVGMAPTASGGGYWLVASDGGVFAFGDAGFFGSTGSIRLNKPVVGMAATPTGNGYWLVASDGGVFAFGDAGFFGSTGSIRLNQPIVGVAASPSGGGYWLVASDGGIFAFGDAGFFGSTGAVRLNRPIVSMARTADGGGYWLAASDGGVFAFGDAPFRGSAGSAKLITPIVGIASGPSSDPYVPGSHGYDISWPQCGHAYPSPPFDFAILGVNGGRPFTHNQCLASERDWAPRSALSVYLNTAPPPSPPPPAATDGPAGAPCNPGDAGCLFYNWGYNAAADAVSYAEALSIVPQVWWLDVETKNSWTSNTAANARVVEGALALLDSRGVTSGIYSTYLMWPRIAGSYTPGRPIWVPGADPANPAAWCEPKYAFAGGKAWLTQYGRNGFDGDYAC